MIPAPVCLKCGTIQAHHTLWSTSLPIFCHESDTMKILQPCSPRQSLHGGTNAQCGHTSQAYLRYFRASTTRASNARQSCKIQLIYSGNPAFPVQCWLFTPELQWQCSGNLTGVYSANAGHREMLMNEAFGDSRSPNTDLCEEWSVRRFRDTHIYIYGRPSL